MSDHYCCKSCGLRECICFVEDIPDQPFYLDKFCIRGPEYKIVSGIDMQKLDIYQIFGEKWYKTIEEAKAARIQMMKIERNSLISRIKHLDSEISS